MPLQKGRKAYLQRAFCPAFCLAGQVTLTPAVPLFMVNPTSSQSVTSHCNPTLGHNTPPWRPGWGCPRCNRRPGGGGRSDRPAATGGFCNQQGDTSFCGGTAFAASSHRPTNRSTIPKLMRLFGGMGLGLRFTCKQLNPSGSTLLHWLLHGTQQTSNKEPPNQVEHMRGPERASPHVH